MNSKTALVILSLALNTALAGCGQKGDLYMPENNRATEASAEQNQTDAGDRSEQAAPNKKQTP